MHTPLAQTGRDYRQRKCSAAAAAPHLCRADCLAELARNAALLACGVPAQGVLATKAVADGSLLKGVVDLHGVRRQRVGNSKCRRWWEGSLGRLGHAAGPLGLQGEQQFNVTGHLAADCCSVAGSESNVAWRNNRMLLHGMLLRRSWAACTPPSAHPSNCTVLCRPLLNCCNQMLLLLLLLL
jgi:hypothetical protein